MPIPVIDQFTENQKSRIQELWSQGKTQEQMAKLFGVPRRTIMKLCKHFGLKRSPKEASTIKSPLDTPEVIEKVKALRNNHSLDEIVKIVGGSPSAVDRLCRKYGIVLDREAYAVVQAERMKSAWTPEKREDISGSRYPELNNSEWLREHYVDKDMSMGAIAKLIDAPLMSVSYHLKRHGIPIKSKEVVYSKLRRLTAKRSIMQTKWGIFKLQSKAEEDFINSLPDTTTIVESEQHRLEHIGLHYIPDFKVDGEFVEIKPIEYSKHAGIDRQAFIKQWLIAQANHTEIKLWYKHKYFYPDPIEDIDRYFCLNWKLLFNSSIECFGFLVRHGFISLQWSRDNLLVGLNHLVDVNDKDCLNVNVNMKHALDFIKHFNLHFWTSTHKGYNTIKSAFGEGNRTILKQALDQLWTQKTNVNIYGLVRIIAKEFKDFTMVSVFRPWIAKHIYSELLPNGGIVIDPCMGWGGRLLGTLDGNYKYVGYDLNPNSIKSHHDMRKFIGARIVTEPEFTVADASKIIWPDGDLLFTSPPYDDIECYDGLGVQCEDVTPIYENIMKFNGVVALNIPKRHHEKCMSIAAMSGRNLIKEYKMITASFMGRRELTYEPILVFR